MKSSFVELWPKTTSAETHVNKHEMQDYYAKNPATYHLVQHATEAYYAEHPAEDHVSKHQNEGLGKGTFTKAGAAKAKDSEFTKKATKESGPLPFGLGPTDDLPNLNLKPEMSQASSEDEEPILKAKKFFPSIRFDPATPILDGTTEREEEPIVAWEPPKPRQQ